jgi:hypothetical protein
MVRDDDRIRKHTGVRNIIQGVLLGHFLQKISYTIPTIPPLPTGPPKKGKLPVLYRIAWQLLHRVRGGSYCQKIETANPARLS